MTVESARYIDEDNTLIRAVIDGVSLTVPNVAANRHRRMITGWEDEGNTIESYVVPPESVPNFVRKLQFVKALRQEILWGTFESWLNTSNNVTQENWDLSYKIFRDDTIVTEFATDNSITETEMDDIFQLANNF